MSVVLETDREICINDLHHHAKMQKWGLCYSALFRALYGCCHEVLRNLAEFSVLRYLPQFEKRLPNERWARRLLDNPSQWIGHKGLELFDEIEEREDVDASDASFVEALYGVLLLCKYKDRRDISAMACSSTVIDVIEAQADRAWIDNDPEAYQMWRNGTMALEPGSHARNSLLNPRANKIRSREWGKVVKYLRGNQIGAIEEFADKQEMALVLQHWEYTELCMPGQRRIEEILKGNYLIEPGIVANLPDQKGRV